MFAFKTKREASTWARNANRGKIGGNVSISCPAGHRLRAKVTTSSAPGFPFAVNVTCKRTTH